MSWLLRGRVWTFDDNVDTDQMAPWNHMGDAWDERRAHLFPTRPDFPRDVQPGDIVVAGRNWGCGSSREQAPENIKLLGVAAVVAESFGRIYFRNSIALSLPGIACPGVRAAFEEGDEIEVDVEAAQVRNLTRGVDLQGHRYTDDMLEIMRRGGLLEVLKDRLAGRS